MHDLKEINFFFSKMQLIKIGFPRFPYILYVVHFLSDFLDTVVYIWNFSQSSIFCQSFAKAPKSSVTKQE